MIPLSVYRRNLRNILSELSSDEYQDRVWLRGEGPEASSFVEAVCTFFEMSLVEDRPVAYWKELGFTEDDILALICFGQDFDSFQKKYPDNACDRDVLSDPEWVAIKFGANSLLRQLDHAL